ELPANLIPTDKIKGLKNPEILDRLQLSEFRSLNGWFYLGWNYAEGSAAINATDLSGIENGSPETVTTPANEAP
ncbi:MAG: hypothetical protein AAF939_12125, partial [Planctomycetota bacterium]